LRLVPADSLHAAPSAPPRARRERVPLAVRLRVWASVLELDRRLAEGAAPTSSPALALRSRQLASRRSRRELAGALDAALRAARRPPAIWGGAPYVAAGEVLDGASELDALAAQLRTQADPPVRGLALVSFLVCDAGSPLYNSGSAVTVREMAARALAAVARA
jgi:hypothetical protein